MIKGISTHYLQIVQRILTYHHEYAIKNRFCKGSQRESGITIIAMWPVQTIGSLEWPIFSNFVVPKSRTNQKYGQKYKSLRKNNFWTHLSWEESIDTWFRKYLRRCLQKTWRCWLQNSIVSWWIQPWRVFHQRVQRHAVWFPR